MRFWISFAVFLGLATLWQFRLGADPVANDRGATARATADRIATARPTADQVATVGFGSFPICAGASHRDCVVDGDTIRHAGIKIRLEDIDTPEVFSPKCPAEAALGHRATERLRELINAGPFQLVQAGGRDRDRYGRKLRTLMRDGRSLGDVLIAEGLARRWDGARRSWCG